MIHQLKEATARDWTSKCGVTILIKDGAREQMTGWSSKVTCPKCKPLRRLRKLKKHVHRAS